MGCIASILYIVESVMVHAGSSPTFPTQIYNKNRRERVAFNYKVEFGCQPYHYLKVLMRVNQIAQCSIVHCTGEAQTEAYVPHERVQSAKLMYHMSGTNVALMSS